MGRTAAAPLPPRGAEAGRPVAGPRELPLRDPGPGPRLARQGPRGPIPEDGPATPAPDLEGDWVVERVLVEGKQVPLPKTYQLRLVFEPGGSLVVHGLQRTKPAKDEGVWRLRDGKLHTRIGLLREVRSYSRLGERLVLTKPGAFPVTWELTRRKSHKEQDAP